MSGKENQEVTLAAASGSGSGSGSTDSLSSSWAAGNDHDHERERDNCVGNSNTSSPSSSGASSVPTTDHVGDITCFADLQKAKDKLNMSWHKLYRELGAFEAMQKESGIDYKMFIGSLGLNTTEADIRKRVEVFGAVKDVILIKESGTGKSKRSCFVKFYNKQAADACKDELNGKVKDGDQDRFMVVRYATEKFGGGDMVGRSAGAGDMVGRGGGKHYGNGGNEGGYTNKHRQPDRNGYGGYSGPRGGPRGGSVGGGNEGRDHRGPPGANILVSNLLPHTTDQELSDMFSKFGEILSFKLFSDDKYAFISFYTVESASHAIDSLNGAVVGQTDTDRGCKIEVVRKRDGNRAFGGGGGGGMHNQVNGSGGGSYGYNNENGNSYGQGRSHVSDRDGGYRGRSSYSRSPSTLMPHESRRDSRRHAPY